MVGRCGLVIGNGLQRVFEPTRIIVSYERRVDKMSENNESKYYQTGPMSGPAPTILHVYKGLRAGDQVKYVGPMPLEGEFIIDEILQFEDNDVLAVMYTFPKGDKADIYEVNADNLEKVE